MLKTTEEKTTDKNGYKLLPKTFKQNGFDFNMIERQGDVAIYSKKKPGYKNFNYEVIKIRRHDRMIIGKNKDGQDIIIEKGEQYPGSTEWGNYGWSYLTLNDAKIKFKLLLSYIPMTNEVIQKRKRGRPRKIV